MPSFANKSTASPAAEDLQPMLQCFRTGNAETVLEEILDGAERNESSPFWKGHLDSEQFAQGVRLFPESLQVQSDPTNARAVRSPITPGDDAKDFAEGDDNEHSDGEDDMQPGKCWLGKLPVNPFCDRVIDITQLEAERYEELRNVLKIWLKLEKPTIEDGGNFGVGYKWLTRYACYDDDKVQEKLANTVANARKTSYSAQSSGFGNYYPKRQKIGMMWCRYPNLRDHAVRTSEGNSATIFETPHCANPKSCLVYFPKNALRTFDRFHFIDARMEIEKLQTHALDVLNLLRNNWTKVCDPKGRDGKERSSTLY
ncbi:hypothetical protein QFC24_005792 [Naganishia onofrii]|uniref:Uncharacterized protein n=1 Tax=Naganishia onofrii TaxID=1851511 RepID=A0ACC2X8D8_9TREE|nr:hypothetical protein QFC24_005792 [Naganishia onofrii]